MFKGYFYLNRLILELQQILINKKIVSCFSQDKDKLIVQTDDDKVWLEISVNHNEPFINLKNRFARAKKNTIDFFEPISRSEVLNVQIAFDDRIVKISTDKGDFYFAIRGKYTNLYFISDDSIQSFKSEEQNILNDTLIEFVNKKFVSEFNLIDLDSIKGKDINEIRSIYRFIGRDIENEVKKRKSASSSDSEILELVLKNILLDKPVVCTDSITNEIHIGFDSFKTFLEYKQESFDNLISAFNYFLIKKYQTIEKENKLKLVNSIVDKELKRLSNKLNNLLSVIEAGSKETEYNKIAQLLLINMNHIDPGVYEVELLDIFDEQKPDARIKVKLDNKISIKKNANRYFEKAKDNKISFDKSEFLYSESRKRFENLKLIQNKLSNIISSEELKNIMQELKIKDSKDNSDYVEESSKFKHYLIEKRYHVFVGKDSQNNDLLTTKFAKQNDYWFHARSVSGSHVVLRVDNTKEAIPKSILKKTASLAAYHSKAKTAGTAPVSYTLKKYVVKRKGMPIGQVSLLKEEVLLVKPEIPVDAEYLTD